MNKPHVLIMAGGTGGHIFPALAVAQALKARGAKVSWLGSPNSMESSLIPETGLPFYSVRAMRLRRSGWWRWLVVPFLLFFVVLSAIKILRRLKPDVVLGMGGFCAGPGGVAAKLCGKPLIIHEQNSKPGLTNRLLAKVARTILTGFPNVLVSRKTHFVGNPVRETLLSLKPPSERFAEHTGRLRLLILGGSLGAQIFNQTVPEALAQFDKTVRPEVMHQAGQTTLSVAHEAYKKHQVDAQVMPFIDDMAAAYAWADLIICRAGALTLAEIMTVGLGAIVIPYPHAVDDHQSFNAAALAETGGGFLIEQKDFTGTKLQLVLASFINDPASRKTLLHMAENSNRLASKKATDKVVEYCLESVS